MPAPSSRSWPRTSSRTASTRRRPWWTARSTCTGTSTSTGSRRTDPRHFSIQLARRLHPVLLQPLPRRLPQPLGAEGEPSVALCGEVGQHALEPPEGARAVQGHLEQAPQRGIGDRGCELGHPAVLDRGRQRLDGDEPALLEAGVDFALGQLVVEAREGDDLATRDVEVVAALVAVPGEGELQLVPVDRERLVAHFQPPSHRASGGQMPSRLRGLSPAPPAFAAPPVPAAGSSPRSERRACDTFPSGYELANVLAV